ncbi:hypothetical protein QS95_17560 [Pseudomonas fluorescens]|uniref:Uncharacterized protein n=1 Tax=Pseudomonas fluorescens TaxID=294 RepID=A0AAE2A615_PSEFL|nr:hypothetical protein QS95_17560 [Pseudomonas fluorescens]
MYVGLRQAVDKSGSQKIGGHGGLYIQSRYLRIAGQVNDLDRGWLRLRQVHGAVRAMVRQRQCIVAVRMNAGSRKQIRCRNA